MEGQQLNWRKASYSTGTGGSCVEVASADTVHVRDTKQNSSGPVLRFTPEAWRSFAERVKTL
jgi:hypothetical protein